MWWKLSDAVWKYAWYKLHPFIIYYCLSFIGLRRGWSRSQHITGDDLTGSQSQFTPQANISSLISPLSLTYCKWIPIQTGRSHSSVLLCYSFLKYNKHGWHSVKGCVPGSVQELQWRSYKGLQSSTRAATGRIAQFHLSRWHQPENLCRWVLHSCHSRPSNQHLFTHLTVITLTESLASVFCSFCNDLASLTLFII